MLAKFSECIKNSSVKKEVECIFEDYYHVQKQRDGLRHDDPPSTKWIIRRKISLLEVFQREEYFLMLIVMECHFRTLSFCYTY